MIGEVFDQKCDLWAKAENNERSEFWFVPETTSIIISRWLLKVAGLANRAGASNEPSIGVENVLAAKPLHVWHAGSKQETT